MKKVFVDMEVRLSLTVDEDSDEAVYALLDNLMYMFEAHPDDGKVESTEIRGYEIKKENENA